MTIDAESLVYTSVSSTNVGAFDGDGYADPFIASSGASGSELWINFTCAFSHSSDIRSDIWSAKLSVSAEHDYFSIGVGG